MAQPGASASLLRQVYALVIEGQPLATALDAIARPVSDYATWSRLWDLLYDAQQESPHRTLRELDELCPRADLVSLVQRAISLAEGARP